ncbi:MAG: beta-carotene 15,15'-monooxygenase [Oligoflexus sp.]|nr:beta-carotene 15,15'-monooxygenase [Pseudopedobacter sp.]
MIQQFRNLKFLNIFILFALLIVLRLGVLWNLPDVVNSGFNAFFLRILVNLDFDQLLSPILNIFLAAIIVFAQALIFNKIINDYNILGKASFLPALLFIVCASVLSPFLILSPPLIANFLILFILNKVLREHKSLDSISTMFDLGLIVAIGTIIYFPFVLFLLVLWIALILFKPFNWREWVSVITGYLTIVFLLGVFYYWNDKLLGFYEIWEPLSTKIPFYIKINVLDYIVLFPISICFILGLIALRANFFKSFVLVRKSVQLLTLIFIVSILSFYLKADFRINHFLLSVAPVAVVLSYYFMSAKKKWIYESLFFLMIIFVVYFQFV